MRKVLVMEKRDDEMTANEAAQYVGVSIAAVHQRRENPNKQLSARQIAGVWVYWTPDLDAWRLERKAAALARLERMR